MQFLNIHRETSTGVRTFIRRRWKKKRIIHRVRSDALWRWDISFNWKEKKGSFQEFVLNILDKRVVRFSLPINYFPAYHSNTLATLMTTQYRFRKQTRIRHGPYVLHSQLVSLGSRTTDYRVIKFKKVVNCPGKSQLSERAVNYDNNPCKIGDTHDCIVSRRTPWNRADRVTVSTRGLKFLASVTGSWDSEPWKKNDNACFACTQSTPTVLSLFLFLFYVNETGDRWRNDNDSLSLAYRF